MSVPDHEQGGDPACWAHLFEPEAGPIVLLPGSLRAGSYTTMLLRRAGALIPDRFVVEQLDDVRALPHYDADLDGENAPAAVRTARGNVTAAAAIIISTPEYNGTIPGGLKNWIDWVTRPVRQHVLIGKPVAVVGGAPNDRGATAAVTWLSDILGRLGAVVVADPVAVPRIADQFGIDGVADAVERRLAALVDAVVAAVDAGAEATR